MNHQSLVNRNIHLVGNDRGSIHLVDGEKGGIGKSTHILHLTRQSSKPCS